MQIRVGTKTLEDSNRFLRAFWAELRRTFPNYAWHFSPSKQPNSRLVYLGQLDLGVEGAPFLVWLHYTRKGDIASLDLEPDPFRSSSRPNRASAEQSRRLLLAAARKAIEGRVDIGRHALASTISSLHMPLSSYRGERFSTRPLDGRRFELIVDVDGYDEADAATNCMQRVKPILDFLSIETNLPFWPVTSPTRASHPQGSAIEERFQEDEDWIDGNPNVGDIGARQSIISRAGKRFIDRILAKGVSSPEEDLILRGCSHFHAGRQQEAYSFELEHAMEVSSYTGSVTQIELAIVLYMSSLEVTSLVGAPAAESCPSCNQQMYRISSRVRDILATHVGPVGAKFANDYYGRRSGYLHQGEVVPTGAYVGKTIPQIDPDDPSLFQTQLSALPLNLREFVSYCLRRTCSRVVAG